MKLDESARKQPRLRLTGGSHRNRRGWALTHVVFLLDLSDNLRIC